MHRLQCPLCRGPSDPFPQDSGATILTGPCIAGKPHAGRSAGGTASRAGSRWPHSRPHPPGTHKLTRALLASVTRAWSAPRPVSPHQPPPCSRPSLASFGTDPPLCTASSPSWLPSTADCRTGVWTSPCCSLADRRARGTWRAYQFWDPVPGRRSGSAPTDRRTPQPQLLEFPSLLLVKTVYKPLFCRGRATDSNLGV